MWHFYFFRRARCEDFSRAQRSEKLNGDKEKIKMLLLIIYFVICII